MLQDAGRSRRIFLGKSKQLKIWGGVLNGLCWKVVERIKLVQGFGLYGFKAQQLDQHHAPAKPKFTSFEHTDVLAFTSLPQRDAYPWRCSG